MQLSSRDSKLQAQNYIYIESCSSRWVVANVPSACTKCTFVFRLIASLVVTFLALPLRVQEASESLPAKAGAILENRCIRCHGVDRSEGQLRLDQSDLLKKKGRAGNLILGSEEESELLRRVLSSDPSFRMPKDETALSDDEIEVLRNWIRSGDGLPVFENSKESAATQKGRSGHEATFWERNSSTLQKIEEFDRPIRVLYFPALVFLVIALLSVRRKRKLVATAIDCDRLSYVDQWLTRLHWPHYLYIGLGFICLGSFLHSRDKVVQIKAQLRELQLENDQWKLMQEQLKSETKPIRPKHPPRLGGTYYRGNDERNPQLFNGGYYRTATFEVALVDAQGEKLEWGDEVPFDGLLIKLDIKRAPFASPQLFSDDVMQNCRISPDAELEIVNADDGGEKDGVPRSAQAVMLTTVVSNEFWTASFRIVESNDSRDSFSGKLFVSPGTPPPHYGIEYAIKVKDGKISEESELWMGSIYHTGSVVLPNPERIQLSEWFDFLPIPEITRENSTDPELIGIQPDQ